MLQLRALSSFAFPVICLCVQPCGVPTQRCFTGLLWLQPCPRSWLPNGNGNRNRTSRSSPLGQRQHFCQLPVQLCPRSHMDQFRKGTKCHPWFLLVELGLLASRIRFTAGELNTAVPQISGRVRTTTKSGPHPGIIQSPPFPPASLSRGADMWGGAG